MVRAIGVQTAYLKESNDSAIAQDCCSEYVCERTIHIKANEMLRTHRSGGEDTDGLGEAHEPGCDDVEYGRTPNFKTGSVIFAGSWRIPFN